MAAAAAWGVFQEPTVDGYPTGVDISDAGRRAHDAG
jgi:hypothetical protein